MAYVFDYQGLGEALQAGEPLQGDDPRQRWLERYRNELVVLLMGLRAINVIGRNDPADDPPTNCDLCSAELLPLRAYVNGMVRGSGMWSNMCATCYAANGAGIGWGIGQLYYLNGEEWQCIGGGNPKPVEDDPVW